MDGGALTPRSAMPLGLSGGALDGLMPMYLWLTPEGRVQGMGATLRKVLGEAAIHGRDLFDLFDLRRPGGLDDMAARVEALCARPTAWTAASLACRRHFETHHTVQAAVQRYLEVFDGVLGR